jgi:uncharacterized protein YbaR (Trm112 family)
MVVVFGWGGGDTKDLGEVAPATCPNCHNEVFLHQLRSTKQFSLYFIPMGNYASNEYLACPVCKSGLQVRKEQTGAVQRMRAATSVYRRGGVGQEQYLAEVRQFWARIGVDANGRQVVGTPAAVPARTAGPPAQVASTPAAAGSPGPSMAEQLRRLGELRDEGVLTDEEFAQAKRRLIG